MASVFRVKRRRNEDPAEALRLSCKRKCISSVSDSHNHDHSEALDQGDVLLDKKSDDPICTNSRSNQSLEKPTKDFDAVGLEPVQIESVLSFAGTISSKDEPISHHIKAAIRNKKLRKEMHPHTNEYQFGLNEDFTRRKRDQATKYSSASRYRVTATRRAIDLQLLDKENKNEESERNKLQTDNLNLNDKTLCPQKLLDTNRDVADPVDPFIKTPQAISLSSGDKASSSLSKDSKNVVDDKMFCVFDIESEEDNTVNPAKEVATSITQSGITMNNVPMVVTSPNMKAPLAESEYVYDLYYTHTDVNDIDLQAVLTVKSLCEEFVNEEEMADRDYICEDEDDSNDEGNWRNDYPDEDPHFFENDDELADCYYAEDMNYRDIVDDGDLLSKWLGTSCKVDSDDEEDDYEDEHTSDSDN